MFDFAGTQLDDASTLGSCGIGKYATVQLSLRFGDSDCEAEHQRVRGKWNSDRTAVFEVQVLGYTDETAPVVWKDYSVVRDEGDEYAAPSAGDIFLDEPSLKQLTCRTRGMRRGGGNGVCVTISASYSMLQSRVKSFHHTTVLVRVPFPRA
jgi:hypothetical protein